MKKLVVFGGTFNPIHNGHLAIIRALAARDDVGTVLVIPTRVPPHKVEPGLPDGAVRLALCRLAVADLEKVEVSDIELRRPKKSYTFDTLTELHNAAPDRPLVLCCGGDMLTTLPTWYRYDGILRLAEIFAVQRVGVDPAAFCAGVARIRRDGGRVEEIPLSVPDISSTALRQDPSRMQSDVPPAVAAYLAAYRLYSEKGSEA